MHLNHLPVAEGIREEFKGFLSSQNIPHASLLVGNEGGTQMAMALFLASSFLCNHPINGLACGKCSSCNKAGQFIHPDLHFSYPLNSSTEDAETKIVEFRELMINNIFSNLSDWIELLAAENSVLNIHAKECSRIERVLSMKSFEGKGKVLIIWLPEFLGNEGNKLLKTIEEPESGTRIILVSCNQKAILPTIVSRCRLFKISTPSIETLSKFLVDQFNCTKDVSLNASAVSEGNVNEAIKTLKNETNISVSTDFIEWIRLSFKSDPMESMDFIDSFIKSGDKEKVRSLFRFGIFYFNQVLRAKYRGDFIRLNEGLSESIIKISGILKIEDIEKIVYELENFLFFIDRFANNKILLTKATLSLGSLFKKAYGRLSISG